MDMVQETGEEIIITKNGNPVSRLVPYKVRIDSLLGLHSDRISSDESDIFSTGESWAVEDENG